MPDGTYENIPVVLETADGLVEITGAAKLHNDQLFVIFSDDFTEDLQEAFRDGDVTGFSIQPVYLHAPGYDVKSEGPQNDEKETN